MFLWPQSVEPPTIWTLSSPIRLNVASKKFESDRIRRKKRSCERKNARERVTVYETQRQTERDWERLGESERAREKSATEHRTRNTQDNRQDTQTPTRHRLEHRRQRQWVRQVCCGLWGCFRRSSIVWRPGVVSAGTGVSHAKLFTGSDGQCPALPPWSVLLRWRHWRCLFRHLEDEEAGATSPAQEGGELRGGVHKLAATVLWRFGQFLSQAFSTSGGVRNHGTHDTC